MQQINCLCDFVLLALAINMLKDQEPGAFVIRDSHSFRGAYGLAMKVASPPPTMQPTKKGISCASSRHAANADNHLPDVFQTEIWPRLDHNPVVSAADKHTHLTTHTETIHKENQRHLFPCSTCHLFFLFNIIA